MGARLQGEEWEMGGHEVFGARGKLIDINKSRFDVSYKMAVRVCGVPGVEWHF